MSENTETAIVISSLVGQFTLTRMGPDKIVRRIPLPAAKAGAVTSGTTDRLLTLTAGHGITTDDLVGVFWTDATTGALKQRIDMTVSAVAEATITVTAATGAGDAFPDNLTTITVSKGTVRSDLAFLATTMQELAATCPIQPGGIAFAFGINLLSNVPASLLRIAVLGGEGYFWAASTGAANPITGTVASVNCYSGATVAVELAIGVLLA